MKTGVLSKEEEKELAENWALEVIKNQCIKLLEHILN